MVSNLALHYIEDLASVYRKVYRTLRPGGTFLFNIEHPVFTAGVGQDWIRDEEGKLFTGRWMTISIRERGRPISLDVKS